MRRPFVLCLCILLAGVGALGQVVNKVSAGRGKQDVLYLKDKWVLRGHLLENSDSLVRIQTQDGNIFVFSRSKIEKIGREDSWERSAAARRGFRNFTELGPLIAGKTTINGVTTAAFSFQTFLGYAMKSYFIPGIGIGADLYATQTVLPFFVSLRGDLARSGNIIPFYFGDLGYGVNITQNSSDGEAFRGGLLYAAGAGIKIPFNRGAGFLLSVGYRYQATSYTYLGTSQNFYYRRLALRAGFYF